MAGRISGVSVASFLELVRLDRKSCRLQITSRGRHGELLISAGEVRDATTGTLTGASAAAELARWEPATIAITPGRLRGVECGPASPSAPEPPAAPLLEVSQPAARGAPARET
jgi:hypothetical protein